MDIVTQGLLGSAVAISGARKTELKHAAWMGAVAGLLADADVLVRSSTDPLLFLEFHRQFSHSLIFIPLGAFIGACSIWLIMRMYKASTIPFGRIYYYAFLGYMLSGVLDAFTSYGTQLLWPFSDVRIAWSLVSIIDPVFSGILLLSLIVSFNTQSLNAVRIGLGLCVLYLGLSFLQSRDVLNTVQKIAAERGHALERVIVKPSLGNIVLWRTVYLFEGQYYVDSVRSLLEDEFYEGDKVKATNIEQDFSELDVFSIQYQDILRFDYFSNGFFAVFPGKDNVIGDIRYSIFPLSVRSLWGIRIDTNTPETHVEFVTFRDSSKEQQKEFLEMLFGRKLTRQ
jgi:inner membrane protein